MINKSMIGLCVKFEAKKVFAPGAGKTTQKFGIVTSYAGHGYWHIVYSYYDGEHARSIIHSSKLERCENASEMHRAIESAMGWARAEQRTITERILSYLNEGDNLAVKNLIEINRQINFITNIEFGNNN